MVNFAINGFGRIGRGILRAFFERDERNINCTVINCGSGDIELHAHLLSYDSTHGHFDGVSIKNKNTLLIRGKEIPVIFETNIENINWADFNVETVLECTGAFNDRQSSYKHVTSGANRVFVSAPCKNADATIVIGVNDTSVKQNDKVISIGSCTTNCLAPIAKVLDDNFTIINGYMTTIHAYTNDQSLLDGHHKDLRRARAANASMIPTSTGAANAIGLVLPQLDGKLTGSAIRVPTINVSLVELVCNIEKSTNADEINKIMQNAASDSMKGILQYCDKPLVSIDFNHNPHSSIYDATQSTVIGNMVKVSSWYDNEWGFANRMLDALKKL